MDFAFGVMSKNSLFNSRSVRLSLFSSGTFTVLCFILKCMIHLDINFCIMSEV